MSTENLHQQEAIEKLKSLVDTIKIGMLCTHVGGSSHIHAIPMTRQEVDDAGHIWFLFSSESETHQNLQLNNRVSLLYADVRDYSFVSISGTAEIVNDQDRIEKYWSAMAEPWFDQGEDDPRVRLLKVIPAEAHYWDNQTNKLVTFLKMATSAVTGQKMDIGRHGDLRI